MNSFANVQSSIAELSLTAMTAYSLYNLSRLLGRVAKAPEQVDLRNSDLSSLVLQALTTAHWTSIFIHFQVNKGKFYLLLYFN